MKPDSNETCGRKNNCTDFKNNIKGEVGVIH